MEFEYSEFENFEIENFEFDNFKIRNLKIWNCETQILKLKIEKWYWTLSTAKVCLLPVCTYCST